MPGGGKPGVGVGAHEVLSKAPAPPLTSLMTQPAATITARFPGLAGICLTTDCPDHPHALQAGSLAEPRLTRTLQSLPAVSFPLLVYSCAF